MMSFFGNRAISTPPPEPRRRIRVLAGAQDSRQSRVERTLHAGDSVATEPDRAGVELDGDLTVTAEALALTGDIRVSLQHAVPAHKRRHTPVAAPAHGILGNPVAWRERAHLNVGASAPGIQAEHVDPRDADRVERRELAHIGRERPDDVVARELDCEPHRSDVDDRRALNVIRHDAKSLCDRSELRQGWLAELWLGQREEQKTAVDLDVDEPLSALLHKVARGAGFEAMA